MEAPTKKIMVYFNNGNRAAFEVDKVTFVRETLADGVFTFDGTPNNSTASWVDILQNGSVVNWAGVAFVREWEERSALDEL